MFTMVTADARADCGSVIVASVGDAVAIRVFTLVVVVAVPTVAVKLDPSPVQSCDRLSIESELDAGKDDVLEVEGVMERPDSETGRILVGLEPSDEAGLACDLNNA